MKFLSQCHVAAHVHAPLHMRRDQVSAAFNDVDEILLVTADGAVGVVRALLNVDGSVIDGDKPATHSVDVEPVGSANTAQHSLVSLHSVKVEYFLRRLWHVT